MKNSRTLALIAAAALLLAGVGVSYAWFSQHAAMSTLMSILPPDSISIIPIDSDDGSAMTMLDLDFKDGDIKDEDGTIHIYRPVCIKSTSPVHQLEVVHTTNLNKLEFKIYPAVATKTAESFTITYQPDAPLSGAYKNPKDGEPSLAKEEPLNNYKTGDTVEVHAYPLYWLAVNSGRKDVVEGGWQEGWREVESSSTTEFDPAKQVEKTYYSTYYMLEISWQEDSKETDLFYVMARNIAVTSAEGSVSTP